LPQQARKEGERRKSHMETSLLAGNSRFQQHASRFAKTYKPTKRKGKERKKERKKRKESELATDRQT